MCLCVCQLVLERAFCFITLLVMFNLIRALCDPSIVVVVPPLNSGMSDQTLPLGAKGLVRETNLFKDVSR